MDSISPKYLRFPPHSAARIALIIYLVVFLASSLIQCSCSGFFAVMAICAVVALVYGSRQQRVLSAGLFLLAIVGFFMQVPEERRIGDKAHQTQLLNEQRLHEQQLPKQ